MDLIVVLALGLILLFGFVVLFGAPYVPTLKASTEDIFDLLQLEPGDHLVELGSGDGRVLRAAGQRGIRATGYELNPLLYVISLLLTWKYRQFVSVKFGNFWTVSWPESDAIYTFLLQKYMTKLDKKIIQDVRMPVKLVSNAFEIPHKTPTKKKRGMFLYVYK